MTGIAEGLARTTNVGVLCNQPTYAARGTVAPRYELRRGVEIWRAAGTTFDRSRLFLRLVNLVTISLSLFGAAWSRVTSGDVVVVTTNPPTLPFLTLLAARLRGARCALLVHDVYPDVLVASGMFTRNSVLVRAIGALQRALYRHLDMIIVIGRDMESLITTRLPDSRRSIVRIPNWADADAVHPQRKAGNALLTKLGLADKFIVEYSGNMGRTHGLEALVAAAERFRSDESVHFLFIGDGAMKRWLERTVVERALSNVTVLPYQPREMLTVLLNACDIAIISFASGMAGVSVPSRMYNVLAAGKPIIAVSDEASELAQLVREEIVGWVVAPGDAIAIAGSITEAQRDKNRLVAMGQRARHAAETKYSYEAAIASYRSVLSELLHHLDRGGDPRPPA